MHKTENMPSCVLFLAGAHVFTASVSIAVKKKTKTFKKIRKIRKFNLKHWYVKSPYLLQIGEGPV